MIENRWEVVEVLPFHSLAVKRKTNLYEVSATKISNLDYKQK